jgi:SARP family transcriptional regulator, regulator of embCAB operon
LRYEILRPLRVVDENGARSITAPKVELLLAVLLSRADQLVTTSTIMAELWPEQPPRRAAAGLHVYVSQLRKFLHRPDRARSPIVTHKAGYLLTLDSDELDAEIFLRLARLGREHAQAGRLVQAEDCLERALGLWRGPLFGDLKRGQRLSAYAVWLTQEKLDWVELLIDVRLALGAHRAVISELYALIEEYPLRESFYRQLMLALYRSERQAEALRVYQTAWRVLDSELGVAPCRSLQRIHSDILNAHDCLEPQPVG